VSVIGMTELPFTGSNMLVIYAIAILMIISGTAILSTTKRTRKNRA
jgi:LPXTG-motif cell wall-anchored protein